MITLLRQSFLCAIIFCALFKRLCRNIDNHVATQFQCSFYQLVRDPSFMLRQDSVQVMLQHCLVLSIFLSRLRKSVATEACCPELDFLLQLCSDVAT